MPRNENLEVIQMSDEVQQTSGSTHATGATARQAAGHQVYAELHESEDFEELRRRYRAFAVPYTVAFLVWYFLYVLMSNWATGFMSIQLFGNINVALVFGLLQFLTTFGIAFLYSRHANRKLDPLSGRLEKRYNEAVGR